MATVPSGYAFGISDAETAVNSLSAVLAGVEGRFRSDSGGDYIGYETFGQSGFRTAFKDVLAENQVRHFVGSVLLGYYWGDGIVPNGFMSMRESLPSGSQPDIDLGEAGISIGARIAKGNLPSGIGDLIEGALK